MFIITIIIIIIIILNRPEKYTFNQIDTMALHNYDDSISDNQINRNFNFPKPYHDHSTTAATSDGDGADADANITEQQLPTSLPPPPVISFEEFKSSHQGGEELSLAYEARTRHTFHCG